MNSDLERVLLWGNVPMDVSYAHHHWWEGWIWWHQPCSSSGCPGSPPLGGVEMEGLELEPAVRWDFLSAWWVSLPFQGRVWSQVAGAEDLRVACRLVLFLFFFFLRFICLFFAVLGLHCCVQAFSSCGEQGLLFIAVLGLLIAVAFLVAEHRL